jgi:predicted RNase H-like HicB family nuclease
MKSELTLDYWKDAEVYVGRIREVPGVFSQGATVAELEANIRNAYELARLDRMPRLGTPVRAKALRL